MTFSGNFMPKRFGAGKPDPELAKIKAELRRIGADREITADRLPNGLVHLHDIKEPAK